MKVPYKRSGLRTYFLLIGILSFSSTPFFILLSIPFFLAGIIIRIWAKGCLHQMKEISMSGPYRFVRHPFYLGNFFLDLGICIMSGYVPLILIAPILWLLVYIPKMKEEEKKMIVVFGGRYKDYQSAVPMWIPYKRPISGNGGFSWKNPNIHTEIPRTFRFISYPLIFYGIYLFKSSGIKEGLKELIILFSCAGILYLLSVEMKRALKKNSLIFKNFSLDHLLICTIALGFFINSLEIEHDYIIWPLGIGLIFFSFLISHGIISHWIRSFSLLTIFEIPWLIILFSPFYAYLMIKNLSPPKQKKDLQYILLIIGLFLSILKERYS